MKRALILHGTDSNPDSNWFQWLKQKLEEQGFEVWVPLLPENHTPNRDIYNDFLLSGEWDFADNIVVGHSSGAVEVMNLLMDERCPHIRLGVMASAWPYNDDSEDGRRRFALAGLKPEQFTNLFPPNGFDFELIKSKADRLEFIHGEDDPYCPLKGAEMLAEKLHAPLTVVPNGQHLSGSFKEFPELWDIIKPNL